MEVEFVRSWQLIELGSEEVRAMVFIHFGDWNSLTSSSIYTRKHSFDNKI